MHGLLVDANAHRRGIRLESARLENFEHFFDAWLVADWWERIIAFAWRFGGVFTGFAVDLIQFLGLIVIRFKVAILQGPFGRETILVPELFEILLAQAEEGCAIDLGVPADVVAKAGMDFATLFVIHRFRGIVFEGAFIAPVVLLARKERPALQDQDLLPARRDTVEQCASTRSSSDDDNVVMVVHTLMGREREKHLTRNHEWRGCWRLGWVCGGGPDGRSPGQNLRRGPKTLTSEPQESRLLRKQALKTCER